MSEERVKRDRNLWGRGQVNAELHQSSQSESGNKATHYSGRSHPCGMHPDRLAQVTLIPVRLD